MPLRQGAILTPAARSSIPVGRSVNRYEVLHQLGVGGMATVYLGRAVGVAGFERLVALKWCHPHLRHDEPFVQMFLDEARIAARIHHPNVVATLDVVADDDLYLVMDYVDGETLSALLKAGPALPAEIARRVMIDVLTGLHAAHTLADAEGRPLHIVHRDISPQNILVGVDGVARITDFGIAKAADSVAVTRDGSLRGKLSYMAPEQLRRRGASPRSDLYAAGVVLWEALAGRRLFHASSSDETVDLVLRGQIPRLDLPAPHARELEAVVLRALAADPAARYASAAEFADALDALAPPPASHRVVAACLAERCAPSIAARRAALAQTVARGESPRAVAESPSVAMAPSAAGAPRDAATAPTAVTAPEPTAHHGSAPSVRSRRRLVAALGAVALLGAATAGVAALTHRASPAAGAPVAPTPAARAPAARAIETAVAPARAPAEAASSAPASIRGPAPASDSPRVPDPAQSPRAPDALAAASAAPSAVASSASAPTRLARRARRAAVRSRPRRTHTDAPLYRPVEP